MKDPLHARVDALMAERKIDALLLTGNTHEHPSFFYLCKGEKLENALLVYKRGGKNLLIGGDMERDGAARTGLDYVPYSQTPYLKIALKHKDDPAAARLAWLSWVLKKAGVKGRLAVYGPLPLERAVSWLPLLRRALKEQGIQLAVEKEPLLGRARETKTEPEIDRMREAGLGTKAAFDALRATIAGCSAKGQQVA